MQWPRLATDHDGTMVVKFANPTMPEARLPYKSSILKFAVSVVVLGLATILLFTLAITLHRQHTHRPAHLDSLSLGFLLLSSNIVSGRSCS